jgi:hypothetical protein
LAQGLLGVKVLPLCPELLGNRVAHILQIDQTLLQRIHGISLCE